MKNTPAKVNTFNHLCKQRLVDFDNFNINICKGADIGHPFNNKLIIKKCLHITLLPLRR